MKRLILILIWGFLMFPYELFAQNDSEYNAEQLALQADLLNFLKEEGYMPEIDSDGDIAFKIEGKQFYMIISKTDDNPMYVILCRMFNYPDEYSRETFILATKELNLYKSIKVTCLNDYYRVGAELYTRDAEHIKGIFYKSVEVINKLTSDIIEECEAVKSNSITSISEIPFIITNMEVANTDKDGNIIQDYGTSIWDYKTKYLKPRITIKPLNNSGTYTVYVKLYKDGSLSTGSSSPSGYSYSYTISMTDNFSKIIELSGWGSNTAGHWNAGDYRFEVWYGDYCIGSKKFKVY